MRTILITSCVLIFACSSSGPDSVFNGGGTFNPNNDNVAGAAGTSGGAGTAGGSSDPCVSSADLVTCVCGVLGQTRTCWPGPVAMTPPPNCKPGQQSCVDTGARAGEFAVLGWGPCTGYTGCTDDGKGGSGGTNDGGAAGTGGTNDGGNAGTGGTNDGGRGGTGGTNDGGNAGTGGNTNDQCPCVGAIRWCDDPVYCHWGQQTCLPNGTWGGCKEVNAGPPGCTGAYFSERCCINQKLCCAWDNNTLVGPCQPNGCP